jgi:hypothetical protein
MITMQIIFLTYTILAVSASSDNQERKQCLLIQYIGYSFYVP